MFPSPIRSVSDVHDVCDEEYVDVDLGPVPKQQVGIWVEGQLTTGKRGRRNEEKHRRKRNEEEWEVPARLGRSRQHHHRRKRIIVAHLETDGANETSPTPSVYVVWEKENIKAHLQDRESPQYTSPLSKRYATFRNSPPSFTERGKPSSDNDGHDESDEEKEEEEEAAAIRGPCQPVAEDRKIPFKGAKSRRE